MRIDIYENGHRFVHNAGATLKLHGGNIIKTITLKNVSYEEEKQVFANPHNDELIERLQKKG